MKLPRGGNYLDPKPSLLRRKLNLRPHKHSGRRLDHAHTSYAGLTFVTLIAGVILMTFSLATRADQYTAPAGTGGSHSLSGAIGLTGTVAGPPPNVAATIDIPKDGQVFTTTPITVAGTCPQDVFLQVYRNDIFAGSTVCDNGHYSLQIDLFDGLNKLQVKETDALNQPGPDSNIVTVRYIPPAFLQPPSTAVADQLRLTSKTSLLRTKPGETVTWTFEVAGGKPPYAITVQWGDGADDVVSRTAAGEFSVSHVYSSTGNKVVSVKAKDATGDETFLQVVTIVEGPATAGANAEPREPDSTGTLLILWPLYGGILLMIIAFWLGKRWRDKKLEEQGVLTPRPA